jgi:hypothetical protein
MSGVGGGIPISGTGGDAGAGGMNPAAGSGGTGAGGMGGGAGGAGGTAGIATGGTGGAAGVGGADAGAEAEAPVLECEQGRETIELSAAELGGIFPYCTAAIAMPAGGLDAVALAVTPTDQGAGAQTMWPDRKADDTECGEGDAFYVDAALDAPRITLCQAFCDALIASGVANVKLELIYGCDPPE